MKMKKLLILLFSIVSFSAFGQSGSMAVSGIKYRVNDSTTYIAAAATAHAQGYADVFWNNQATTPHFDIWNGSSYEHVFVFGGSGGGSGDPLDIVWEVQTGTSYIVDDSDHAKWILFTNASGCSITLPASVGIGKYFTAIRATGAGEVQFTNDGISSELLNIGNDYTLQVDEAWCTWAKYDANVWRGGGAFGTSGGGGTWGSITGTLGDQTDLSTALDGKVNDTGNETIAGTKTFSSTIVGSVNGNAATVTTNANLTGDVTSSGNATTIASGVIVDADVNASAAIAGTKLANTPSGTVAATTVQAAINELDGEKAPLLITEVTYTADFTLDNDDIGKKILINSTSPVTVTMPSNATESVSTGAYWTLVSINTGAVTIAAGAGASVTRNSAGTLSGPGQNQPFIINKVSTNGFEVWNGGPPPTGSPITGASGLVNVSFTANNAGLESTVGSASLTGISSLAIGDLVTASAVNTFGVIPAVATNRVMMSAGTNTLPAYSTATYLPTVTDGRILHATATNVVGQSANLSFTGQLFVANGGTQFAYAAKTTTYAVTTADRFIECTSGSFTVTLPTAVGKAGFVITIDNSGAGTITLATFSSQTIDGIAPGTLISGQKTTLYSNGANWRTF